MIVDAGSLAKGQGVFSFRAVISCLEKRFPVMSENEHSAVASLRITGFGCVRGCDSFFFFLFRLMQFYFILHGTNARRMMESRKNNQ